LKERGRDTDGVIEQYMKTVRPMHLKYVEPSKVHADVIVPVGLNQAVLDMVIARLRFAAQE
jgi:uridine kinase